MDIKEEFSKAMDKIKQEGLDSLSNCDDEVIARAFELRLEKILKKVSELEERVNNELNDHLDRLCVQFREKSERLNQALSSMERTQIKLPYNFKETLEVVERINRMDIRTLEILGKTIASVQAMDEAKE